MLVKKKKLYEYNIRTGHYERLNEDDANAQSGNSQAGTQNTTEDTTKEAETKNTAITKSQAQIDAEDKAHVIDSVQKPKAESDFQTRKTTIDNNYTKELNAQKELLGAAQKAASEATDKLTYVKAIESSLAIQQKIADIELKHVSDLMTAELNHAREINKLELQKIDFLKTANTAYANESYKLLPEKYRKALNESNIHQAKIYMQNLVVNDEVHIIKDMRDFKRVFCESELVYGKDKNGYYVICIDEEDFNKLYETLQREGYKRDEIFAVVMPQILDRSGMINTTIK